MATPAGAPALLPIFDDHPRSALDSLPLRDPDFITWVRTKVSAYGRFDRKRGFGDRVISVEDALELLENRAGYRCWLCAVPLATPYGVDRDVRCGHNKCLRQVSFDRIDNDRGHSTDNLRIICFGCNSKRGLAYMPAIPQSLRADSETVGPGACPGGCHPAWKSTPTMVSAADEAMLNDFLVNPEPELTRAMKIKALAEFGNDGLKKVGLIKQLNPMGREYKAILLAKPMEIACGLRFGQMPAMMKNSFAAVYWRIDADNFTPGLAPQSAPMSTPALT